MKKMLFLSLALLIQPIVHAQTYPQDITSGIRVVTLGIELAHEDAFDAQAWQDIINNIIASADNYEKDTEEAAVQRTLELAQYFLSIQGKEGIHSSIFLLASDRKANTQTPVVAALDNQQDQQ